MKELEVIRVNIGKVGIARDGETLQTILGSCVGIGFLFKERGLYGLAHCLLPEIPSGTEDCTEARFVDQGISTLIREMRLQTSDLRSVQAVIVGGASLFRDGTSRVGSKIGPKNIHAAKSILRRLQIKVVFEDCGQNFGRQLFIYGRDGTYEVKKIQAEAA